MTAVFPVGMALSLAAALVKESLIARVHGRDHVHVELELGE